MALPNPQGKLVDNTGKQVVTLGELLRVQTDVEKWSQNTDINTFRSGIEAQKGFDQLVDSQRETTDAVNKEKKTIEDLFPDGKGINSATQLGIEAGAGDAFKRVFRNIAKPFEGIGKNLNDFKFAEMGTRFFSLTRGAERVNSGFKELTNGIGEFGPVINSLKTGIFKAVAGLTLLRGVIEMILSSIISLPSTLSSIFNGIKTFFTTGATRMDDSDLEQGMNNEARTGGDYNDLDQQLNNLGDRPETNNEIDVFYIDGTTSYFENMRRAFGLALTDINLHGKAAEGNTSYEDNKTKLELDNKKKEKEHRKKELDIRLKRNKAHQKNKEKNEKKFFNFRKKQEMKFRLMQMAKLFLPILLIVGGIIAVVDIFKNKINEFADTPLAGIFAGLKTGLTKAGEQARSMFSGLKNFLGKMFPKMFPKTAPKPPKVDPKKTVTKVLKEGADDVGKEAAKTSGKEMAKTLGKQVVKKIPVIGAVAETAMDATSNEKKFNKIKTAYENQVPIMPDGNGGLRPMTAEEFAAAEASMTANRAGSGGRGAGAFAGAATGAATGAAIGSVIPVVGTAIGGIIGGVLGGFFGGRAGDKVATQLANNAEGIDDPQAYIDMLAQNVPELQNETAANLENARVDVADATSTGGGGSSSVSTTTIDSSSNSSSTTYNEISMVDSQAELSYS